MNKKRSLFVLAETVSLAGGTAAGQGDLGPDLVQGSPTFPPLYPLSLPSRLPLVLLTPTASPKGQQGDPIRD